MGLHLRLRRAAVLGLLLPVAASAMQDQTPVLHSETRVVQIDVAVRDAHGVPVSGLTKNDFTIKDEGKTRAIAIFSVNPNSQSGQAANAVSSQPQTLSPKLPPGVFSNKVSASGPPEHVTVILLDGILSSLSGTNGSFDEFVDARRNVINLMAKLPGTERIAIYAASKPNHYVPYATPVFTVVQDFTSDRNLLRKSITAWWPPVLRVAPPFVSHGKSSLSESPTDPAAEFVAKMDAKISEIGVYQATMDSIGLLRLLAEHLALLPGRKSLIWVTPGVPPRLLNDHGDLRDNTIAVLNDANVALSAVEMRGLGGPYEPPHGPGDAAMRQLAEATGGKAYYDRNDIDGAIAQAMADSRTNYTLGFYLAENERDDAFHKLTVQVNRPGLTLHYRQGYIAGSLSAKLSSAKEDLDAARLNPVDADAIGILARTEVLPGKPRATLHLVLSLDSHGLSLRQNGDTSAGKVDEKIVELDERGAILGQVEDTKLFEIPGQGLEHFRSAGVSWEQKMPLMPGAASARVIVRDSATGRVGSLSIPLRDVK